METENIKEIEKELEKDTEEVNEKFLIKIQGKNYVTYEGLLDLAHKKGLKSIDVELLQIPNRENGMVAICKATASTEDMHFVDLGDASPSSVKSNFVPHIIRMASTRAKARALRDFTNVGITALEELSFDETDDPSYGPANEGQINRLKKLMSESQEKINVDFNNLSKREAGELILKLQESK